MSGKKIIMLSAFLLVLATVTATLLGERLSVDQYASVTANESAESLAMHEEYPELPKTNRFVRESTSDTIKRFEEGTGIIFLGFKECPWCQQLVPILNEAADAEGVDVYYLDVKKVRENNSLEYSRIVSILSPHLNKDEEGQPRLTVPDISFMHDGEISWRYKKELAPEEERAPSSYWTAERKDRAIGRFREQIKNLSKENEDERV